MKTETLVCDQCGKQLDTDGTGYISIICTHHDGRVMVVTYAGAKPCPRLDFCCLDCLTRFFIARLAVPAPSPAEDQPRPVVHLCPHPGSGLTRCCRRPILELPRADSLTLDAVQVNCPSFSTPKTQPAPE